MPDKSATAEIRADLVTINTPTLKLAHELETAYAWFNERLFSSKLKNCVILMHRKKGARGYFWANRWRETTAPDDVTMHEIALNPDDLKGREVKQILSTLVHEQVHLWQEDFGKPGKRAGHNREWADKMEELGLMPTNTGEPGGKRTGRRVTHYIVEGEEFDLACNELLDTGFTLSCISWLQTKLRKPKVPRVTVECSQCELRARVREETVIRCGSCKDEDDEYVILEPI